MAPLTLAADLHLAGLSRPLRLLNCGHLYDDLNAYFPGRVFSRTKPGTRAPLATLAWSGQVYRLTTEKAPEPAFHKTAVNAFCDLIAYLPYAEVAGDKTLLTLHAAAIQIAGCVVLMPAVRRSGKSLLTAAVAARSAGVFSDDVVGLSARPGGPLTALASGVAPRLRLPLPDGISPFFSEFIKSHAGPENAQYRYLTLDAQPAYGTAAPIGAVMVLDRREDGAAQIDTLSRGDILKRLLHQNFSRDRGSAEVMAALFCLAETASALRLTYSAPEDAAALILDKVPDFFPRNPEPPIVPRPALHSAPRADLAQARPDQVWVQNPGADLRMLDGDHFAVSQDGMRIVNLDDGAMRVWTLLSEPLSSPEVAGVLAAAFPDTDKGTIAGDTARVFEKFINLGLIIPA